MTRRLSLREKVLIRSAIQQANSPPDSPSKVTIPQPQLVDSESNATHHAEPTIASNTTASEQESIPQHPPSPRKASALQTLVSPIVAPPAGCMVTSARQQELETAASMCSAGDAQTESCHDEMSLITAQPTTPRSVPLPETPLGERAYLLQPATPGTAENKPMRTPTRPKFVSEMSSPVMHVSIPAVRDFPDVSELSVCKTCSTAQWPHRAPSCAQTSKAEARGYTVSFKPVRRL